MNFVSALLPDCRLDLFSIHFSGMHNRFKKLILMALLLILPLQALASALTPILCHSDAQERISTPQAQLHDHNAPTSESVPAQEGNGDATSDYAGHLCCHHPVGGMPVMSVIPADTESSSYASLPPAWLSLFAPEQQLRPPRS